MEKKTEAISLPDKHQVRVTLFKGIVYIHIRHRFRPEKTVSLSLSDYKGLLAKREEIGRLVKDLRKPQEEEEVREEVVAWSDDSDDDKGRKRRRGD